MNTHLLKTVIVIHNEILDFMVTLLSFLGVGASVRDFLNSISVLKKGGGGRAHAISAPSPLPVPLDL